MIIKRNISLRKYNTFGLDYIADCVIHIRTDKEAGTIFRGDIFREKPLLTLGRGSNILFTGNFKGIILRPEFGGMKIEEKDGENVLISAGAGVTWDKLVEWSVKNGFSGLENLSLIPGTVGASPVQNIGAYGVEVKDSIEKVRTICLDDGSIRVFSNYECEFGYRSSIFQKSEKGRYLITKVYFKLTTIPSFCLSYGSLKKEVQNIGSETLINVRQAVINIRRAKLPDPDILGNAGSFFKNPEVKVAFAEDLQKEYPLVPLFNRNSGSVKLAAGWLIDQCGWKGQKMGDAGVHNEQALVLVNYGKATGMQIYNLSEAIKESVKKKFGVELEREVQVIGAI
jgi:UDP-N-acetylmuramate dehydrogenase